jgi:hypothetical protein
MDELQLTKPKRQPYTPPPMPEPTLGPTKEAMRHGEYVQGNAGSRAVWTNRRPNMLMALRGSGSITGKQCAAGLCFIETWTGAWYPGARDSTQPIIGGEDHETETQAERVAKQRARCNTILNRIGPKAYSQLVSVAVFDEPMGNYRKHAEAHVLFKASLDQCVVVYGISEEA